MKRNTTSSYLAHLKFVIKILSMQSENYLSIADGILYFRFKQEKNRKV